MQDGFDAAVEFQPFSPTLANYTKNIKLAQYKKKTFLRLSQRIPRLKKLTKPKMHSHFSRIDYEGYLSYVINNYQYPKDYKRFPGVMPSWDNTARKKSNSFLFYNNSPQSYKNWLQFHKDNFHPDSAEENFIFINAWNEWAEGNHLEPCRRWGRKYLEATKEVLMNTANNTQEQGILKPE